MDLLFCGVVVVVVVVVVGGGGGGGGGGGVQFYIFSSKHTFSNSCWMHDVHLYTRCFELFSQTLFKGYNISLNAENWFEKYLS